MHAHDLKFNRMNYYSQMKDDDNDNPFKTIVTKIQKKFYETKQLLHLIIQMLQTQGLNSTKEGFISIIQFPRFEEFI